MNTIAIFNALQKIIAQRREQVAVLLPHYVARQLSDRVVADMLTPGTPANALMKAICMVIAEEAAFRNYQSELKEPK
jgi:hypothetical protein